MKSPLAFSPIAGTKSAEETEHLYAREFLDSRITSTAGSNDFGVRVDGVSIGNSTLSFVSHYLDYELDNGDVQGQDFVLFGFGFGHSSSASFNGQHVPISKNALIFNNGARLRQKRSAGTCEVLVKCPTREVEIRIQTLLDRSIARELRFGTGTPLDSGLGAHARSTILYILDSLKTDPSLLANPLITANFEELMLNIILSMPSNYSEELLSPGRRLKAPSIVVRAEEFMEASAGLPITIADVLDHTGGSRKALLANFRKYRGYSPNQFLTNTRLKLVHQTLSNPAPTDSVTSVAYRFGFSHLGRFSRVYRERYRVRPSETLRQAKFRQ